MSRETFVARTFAPTSPRKRDRKEKGTPFSQSLSLSSSLLPTILLPNRHLSASLSSSSPSLPLYFLSLPLLSLSYHLSPLCLLSLCLSISSPISPSLSISLCTFYFSFCFSHALFRDHTLPYPCLTTHTFALACTHTAHTAIPALPPPPCHLLPYHPCLTFCPLAHLPCPSCPLCPFSSFAHLPSLPCLPFFLPMPACLPVHAYACLACLFTLPFCLMPCTPPALPFCLLHTLFTSLLLLPLSSAIHY